MSIQDYEVFGYTYVGGGSLAYSDHGGGPGSESNVRVVIAFAEEHELSVGHVSYSQWNNWTGTYPWRGDEFAEYLDDEGDPPDVFIASGNWGSESVYVRVLPEQYEDDEERPRDEHLRDLVRQIQGLEDYPILDEDDLSEVELSREEEMWAGWLESELIRSLPDFWEEMGEFQRHPEAVVECPMFDTYDAYRWAMDVTNTYVSQEPSGAYVSTNEIERHFLYNVVEQVTGVPPPMSAYTIPGGYYASRAPEDSPFDEDEWKERVEEWVRNRIEDIEGGDNTWQWQEELLKDAYAEMQDEKVQ